MAGPVNPIGTKQAIKLGQNRIESDGSKLSLSAGSVSATVFNCESLSATNINLVFPDTTHEAEDGSVGVPSNCENFLVIIVNGVRKLIPLFDETGV